MKYIPFVILDLKMSRKIILIFEMLFWPVISLSSLGFFAKFVDANYQMKLFLFTGAIGWSCVYFSHVAVNRGFLSELWDKTLKQTFSSPVSLRDFIIGHWLYGLIGSTIGFLFMSLATLFLFNFNMFNLGIYIPLTILLGSICGLIIGTVVVSLIVSVGRRIDFLALSIVDMIVFISGVYYSVNIFPQPIQIASHFFPVIYMLEGMRGILLTGIGLEIFIKGYLISLAWIAVILVLIKKIETYARKTGFYQRYG